MVIISVLIFILPECVESVVKEFCGRCNFVSENERVLNVSIHLKCKLMAIVKNYLGIRGRIGDFVLYRLGDKTFLRKWVRWNKSSTEEQQAVRARFRAAVRFYQKVQDTPLKRMLDISAKGICVSGYAFHMKVNLKVFRPDGKIGDFSQLQFTAGKREQGYNWTGWIDKQGEVTLQWGNSVKGNSKERRDRLMVVVLLEGRSFSPVLMDEVNARRKDGKATFRVWRVKREKVYLYCFFMSPDEKQLSVSQYVCLEERE